MPKLRIRYTFLFLFFLPLAFLTGQVSQTEFGKNRVQYHQDFEKWSQYESQNFITFWYGEGRFIGQAAVQIAEYNFQEIQNILEHRMNDKIQIIVYSDLTDLKQSNIGSEEAFYNTGGQTKIVGNKIFIYFNGDHRHLRKQIREGIASVYLNAMLFGANLQEIVQNAVMMNLPDWFKEGLVSYIGQSWSAELDNQLRDALQREDFKDFSTFARDYPQLAGHSLWYFIGENYGTSTVSNLLYLTRINRSLESGFLYVLGSTFERTTASWTIYFKERYKEETQLFQEPKGYSVKVKNKRKVPLSELKISPDGKKIAYVTNEIGKYRVFVQDMDTGERQLIFHGGFRNAFQATDYNYPLLAWHPSGFEIAVIYEKRDVVKLMLYDLNTKESVTEDMSSQYQRIYSMDFINANTMVFSGAVRGFSDIFLYFTNTRQTERITNDFYDDLDATYVRLGDQRGILFASNRKDSILAAQRLDTILPVDNFDLFYYDLENKSKELVKITNTPHASERNPVFYDTTYFAFLSDESGVINRKTAYLEDYIHHYDQVITLKDGEEIILHIDSTLSKLDSALIDTIIINPVVKQKAITYSSTNYNRNIISHHTSPRSGRMVELVFLDGLYQIYQETIDPSKEINSFYSKYKQQNLRLETFTPTPPPEKEAVTTITIQEEEQQSPVKEIEIVEIPEEKPDTGKIDIDNYLFQSEFDDEEMPVVEKRPPPTQQQFEENIIISSASAKTYYQPDQKEVIKFRPGRIIPYRLKFRTDFFTTQLDNSLLFEGLDSYAGTPQGFDYPPPGILLKTNFKDLFEDYEFEGGIRVPTSFNGTEYFLIFDDKKKRLDKRYAFYRKNLRYTEDNSSFVPRKSEALTVLGQYGVRYPLDIFRSLRATSTLRMDKFTQLATDAFALNVPTDRGQRIGLKLEYVFDNTLDVSMNIKNGTRYKFSIEAVKSFEVQFVDEFKFEFNKGFMGIIGVDARHYQRLLRHSVFASRFAASASFGSEKILYYLGGVDSWLFPKFNDEIPIPQDNDIAFRTMATSIRGFNLNIRNGNSYALLNNELRIPVFNYISSNIRSSFLKNFQLVGFFDLGTAWTGLNPFSEENPLNTISVKNGELVVVKINYFRDPVVAGYGAGFRSTLFGYFIRVDYAWGIETRKTLDPKLFISMGLDF
ncbi:MAG: hypothetical protein GY705_09835 [Bacteroidetes bacterium]|nr:hypothetical protein [Bacteroidota bacterium]